MQPLDDTTLNIRNVYQRHVAARLNTRTGGQADTWFPQFADESKYITIIGACRLGTRSLGPEVARKVTC